MEKEFEIIKLKIAGSEYRNEQLRELLINNGRLQWKWIRWAKNLQVTQKCITEMETVVKIDGILKYYITDKMER